MYAIDAENGTLVWSFATNNPVRAGVVLSLDKSTVYVCSTDALVYALDAGSGKLRWTYATQGLLEATPVESHDGTAIFIGSTDNKLHVVSTVNGDAIWKYAADGPMKQAPALSADGGRVYVGAGSELIALYVPSRTSPPLLMTAAPPAPLVSRKPGGLTRLQLAQQYSGSGGLVRYKVQYLCSASTANLGCNQEFSQCRALPGHAGSKGCTGREPTFWAKCRMWSWLDPPRGD